MSSNLKSYSPFGDNNLAIIGEVSIAKKSNIIKKEGIQGNLFKALIRAIKPSKPSMIGWVSVTFLSKSVCNVLVPFSRTAILAKLFFRMVSSSLEAKLCLAIFSLKTGPLPSLFVPAVPSASLM